MLLGNTFRSCEVDIEGPYTDPNTDLVLVNDAFTVRASESESVIFYCRFTYHDLTHSIPDNDRYNFILTMDSGIKRTRIALNNQWHSEDLYNVTNIDLSNQTNASNVLVYESRVSVSSVTNETLILVPKCAVEYFTILNSGSNKVTCLSSTTFVIFQDTLPITTPPECPTTPTTTVRSLTSPTTATLDDPVIDTQSGEIFGSTVGVLFLIVITETALIMIFIIYQFVKHKKSQGSSKVASMAPSPARDTDSEIYSNTILLSESPNNRQRISLPNSADSDSAMGTASATSDFVGDANNA